MSVKVGIWFFSGTGVTDTVANMINDELARRGCTVDLMKIEDSVKSGKTVVTDRYDLVGIGCPVIGFGLPNIVADFLKLIPKTDAKKTFIFRTAGGVAPINYNASNSMIAKLSGKGYDVFHERLFSIASNWIVGFDDKAVKRLYEATALKTLRMCGEILEGKRRTLETGLLLRTIISMTKIIFPLSMRLTGKSLRADNKCTHCGVCVKHCPADNISIKNGKVCFGFSCSCCMRCVYQCPTGALNFGMTPSYKLVGGFNLKNIVSQKESAVASTEGRIPPFMEKYLADPDM